MKFPLPNKDHQPRLRELISAGRQRAVPRSLGRMPIDALESSIERLRLQGGKTEALRLARTAVRSLPGSGKAYRYLVRSLLTRPVTTDNVIEARVAAETMIRLWDDTGVSQHYADVLIAQHEHGVEHPDLVTTIITFCTASPTRRLRPTRTILHYLIDAGDQALALRVCSELTEQIPNADYALMVHEAFLRCERLDLAVDFEARSTGADWLNIETLPLMAASRQAVASSHHDAIATLESRPPHRTRRFSQMYCEALRSTGQWKKMLSFLDSNIHNLPIEVEATFRFDSLRALGDAQRAASIINAAARSVLYEPAVVSRVRLDAGSPEAVSESFQHEIQQLFEHRSASESDFQRLTTVMFELDQISELVELGSRASERWRLGPIGRYNLARSLYVQRNFDEAAEVFSTLTGSSRHWEARKFSDRILLERGHAQAALQSRLETDPTGRGIDEVALFARLQLGEYSAGFSEYLDRRDALRLDRQFGAPPVDAVGHLFVIGQNGPGDDIQFASMLRGLSATWERVTMTCEPRLQSLLARSFPNIDFLPVERISPIPRLGSRGSDAEPRPSSELHDVLTTTAEAEALRADRVSFARGLYATAAPGDEPPRHPAYITPLACATEAATSRLAGFDRPIGVVWRSELCDAMRSIHYVEAADLAPLSSLDRTFVCLQYDATETERDVLASIFGTRIVFVDDIDLRDDFESTAGIVSELDAVVGVGTTVTELAAAVGTTTIFLQPNHFGSWRAIDDDANDFWHLAARHAVVTDPRLPASCVDIAADLLRQ